jgi:hypothetical protein
MRPHRITMLALIVAAAALAATGCDSDQDTPATATAGAKPAAAKRKPLPADGNYPLIPGTRYVTGQFAPKFSIVLPDGAWRTGLPESDELVDIQLLSSPPTLLSVLGVQRIERVFDPRKGGRTAADAVPGPDDFAAWLRSHPRLETSQPVDVKLGGAEGVQIDVTPRSYPRAMPDECHEVPAQCVPLFVHAGEPIVYPRGTKARFYVLDVDGEQVVAELDVAPEDQFAAKAPVLEAALRTVRFEQ